MLNWLVSSVPSRTLGLTRVGVGAATIVKALVVLPVLMDLTDPTTLRAPFFDAAPRIEPAWVIVLLAAWIVSAAMFTIGWRVVIAGPSLLLCIVITLALDQQAYSNHLYLIAWLVLLLTLADAGAGLSIGREDRPVARWPLVLVMSQVSMVYAFSGLTKINETFLSGSVLASAMRGGVVPFPEQLRAPAFLSALAVVVIAVELFLSLMLWSPSYRPVAYVVGVGLHTSITLLMARPLELLVFSMAMLAVYPLFDQISPARSASTPETIGSPG